ncbi:MAG: hypothetical protein WCK29_01540 [archaeon]
MSKEDIAFAIGATFLVVSACTIAYRGFERKLEKVVSQSNPALVTANTIGNSTPDKFYQIGTNRAYVEIDGRSIESYNFGGMK